MVLSTPVAWTAQVQATPVEKVEFLIDGKLLWSEKKVPYTFNDDGGTLAPWLLPPGQHDLTVRATSTQGQTAEAVARVTTRGPQPLPSGLAGTFTRMVTQAPTAPVGKWVMHLKGGLLTYDDPNGSGGGEAVSADSGSLKMFGPPNWLLPEERRGGFCGAEPPVAFTWSRTGPTLTISGAGNCADRDGVFVGTWRKQG